MTRLIERSVLAPAKIGHLSHTSLVDKHELGGILPAIVSTDESQRIFASVAPVPNEKPIQRRNSNLASQKRRTLITESKSICGSDNNSPAQNTPRAIALTKSVRRSIALRVSGFDLCISLALVWKSRLETKSGRHALFRLFVGHRQKAAQQAKRQTDQRPEKVYWMLQGTIWYGRSTCLYKRRQTKKCSCGVRDYERWYGLQISAETAFCFKSPSKLRAPMNSTIRGEIPPAM